MEKRSCGCGMKSKAERNASLTKDAKAIVAGIEGYSNADRTKRAAEVKAAFPPKTVAKSTSRATAKTTAKPVAKKSTAKTATRSTGKSPKLAGMSTGSHSGETC